MRVPPKHRLLKHASLRPSPIPLLHIAILTGSTLHHRDKALPPSEPLCSPHLLWTTKTSELSAVDASLAPKKALLCSGTEHHPRRMRADVYSPPYGTTQTDGSHRAIPDFATYRPIYVRGHGSVTPTRPLIPSLNHATVQLTPDEAAMMAKAENHCQPSGTRFVGHEYHPTVSRKECRV